MRLPSGYVTCWDSPFSHVYERRGTVYISRCHVIITRSNVLRTCCGSQKARSLACGFKVSAVGPYFLLFDYQEAFHCCLVVACINRINMISIQCHRVGQWWAGKPEFEHLLDSGQGKSCVYSLSYFKPPNYCRKSKMSLAAGTSKKIKLTFFKLSEILKKKIRFVIFRWWMIILGHVPGGATWYGGDRSAT